MYVCGRNWANSVERKYDFDRWPSVVGEMEQWRDGKTERE